MAEWGQLDNAICITIMDGKLPSHDASNILINTPIVITAIEHGLMIYIPENIVCEPVIILEHKESCGQQILNLQHCIIAAAHSKATVILSFIGSNADKYSSTTATTVHVADGAALTQYTIQEAGDQAEHYNTTHVKQESNSIYNGHVVSWGGQLSRNDLYIDFIGSGATCLLNGIVIAQRQQHNTQWVRVNHAIAGCHSSQEYKSIVMDQATVVFDGLVHVAAGASKTVASQRNKNLLLSSKATVHTRPQLEILTDDVSCSHGATVGQLDAAAVLYLRSRGLTETTAKQILIQAFVAANIDLISHIGLVEMINQHMIQQLQQWST